MNFVWSIVTVANTGHKLPYEVECIIKIIAIWFIIFLPFEFIKCLFKHFKTDKKEDKEERNK